MCAGAEGFSWKSKSSAKRLIRPTDAIQLFVDRGEILMIIQFYSKKQTIITAKLHLNVAKIRRGAKCDTIGNIYCKFLLRLLQK